MLSRRGARSSLASERSALVLTQPQAQEPSLVSQRCQVHNLNELAENQYQVLLS